MSEHPNAAVIRSAYEAMGKGDVAAFAALLDDDIIWYESTSGMEGVYRGRDEVMAFLGQVFQQSGMQMSVVIHDVLANDDHGVILHESTITVGDRSHTGQYADVYHLREGKLTAHWHLAVDAKADAAFASEVFAS
ncbi:nuclear transport factor 2 family protein [Nocardioides islandensis]|jgi:ketosteroid isomerase-like protein|uniref:Nuclear transport factor 2 family protein n=1 Tax=Nocardioides islandensis TaxID=433663 RepID=A0A930VBC4_9ACTN|nr:nuclear transport factor 2 family protein [Nocardioides islandensis]MBF4764394.1 nuclear transport factor 2 family protein [Nocardioides islandensis]